MLSKGLDPRCKLLKQLDESLKENIKEVMISNVERVVGDIDCTMADSDITIADCGSNSQGSSSQDPPMAKKAKQSALDILLRPEDNTMEELLKMKWRPTFMKKCVQDQHLKVVED